MTMICKIIKTGVGKVWLIREFWKLQIASSNLAHLTIMNNNPLKNRFWEISPAIPENYIPDDQEVAEWEAIEEKQKLCKHVNYNDEDGCLDCGYYAK